MRNALNWFEIPAKNFDRAKKFYETILGKSLEEMQGMPDGFRMAMLPYDRNSEGVGGGIVQGEGYEPSRQGVLIYLNGGKDLGVPLAKVEKAGGKILVPKTSIGEHGFMAQFEDTEGNRIALHSME
jgi:predicted enzyme related to lactoylglutathione lyase